MESKEMQKSRRDRQKQKSKRDKEETARREEIKEMGPRCGWKRGRADIGVRLLTIIGEIEGHEAVSGNTKATKYEHLLPKLAEAEDSR